MNRFCPNYHNKEVFDKFNEMIEALGGQPMTEEEFKSVELRSQRTGLDFAAMEAAYTIFEMNNGHFLDQAPNGNPSILYSQLLRSYKGDRKAALKAKSVIYSQAFHDKYGNWSGVNDFNINNVDQNKVDVVYTDKPWKNDPGKSNSAIRIYLKDQHEKGYFELVKDYEYGMYSVHFKTAKPGAKYNSTNTQTTTSEERKILFEQLVNAIPNGGQVSTWGSISDDGIRGINNVGRDMTPTGTRSVTRKSDGSTIEIPIYRKGNEVSKVDINGEPLIPIPNSDKSDVQKENSMAEFSSENTFGFKQGKDLDSGSAVSSISVVNQMLLSNSFNAGNLKLAQVLSVHDVPVKYGTNPYGTTMRTVYDETGGAVIIIDPQQLIGTSTGFVGQQLLHEMVHAITWRALHKPISKIEKSFAKQTTNLHRFFDKVFPQERYLRTGDFYGLENADEFAAEFVTNSQFRSILYRKAKQIDKQTNGRMMSIFKSAVNSISELFVNKKLFTTNVEKLDQYKKTFDEYMSGIKPVKKGGLNNGKLFKSIYDQIDISALSNEQRLIAAKEFNRLLSQFKQSSFIHINTSNRVSEKDAAAKLDVLANDCATYLTLRVKALMASNLNDLFKSKNKQILDTQIETFKQGYESIYQATSLMLTQIAPQLEKDCVHLQEILNSGQSISMDSYMYQMHDNFGTYTKILGEIETLMENETVRQIFADQADDGVTQRSSTVNSIASLMSQIQKCKAISQSGEHCLKQLLIRGLSSELSAIGKATHDCTLEEYLDELERTTHDMNWVVRMGGSADKMQDSGIRTMSYLVTQAINKAEEDTYHKSTKLLKLQSNLKLGESVKDLYEVDDRGITTGYLVRDLNFGKFEKDYNEFLKSLNQKISKKYGVLLEPDCRIAPDINDDARREWLKLQNDWLDKHCERRFKREYYDYYNQMSSLTRTARAEIQSQISQIKSLCVGDDGYYHFDKLSQQDYDTLQKLQIQKRLLASDYNVLGQLKEEGTVEYQIAKELQELNKKLRPSKLSVKRNYEAWKAQRDAVIEQCGGKAELEKFEAGEPNKFDYNKLADWDYYNSKRQFKRDEDGNVLLFKMINDEVGEPIIYNIGDQGKQYESLKQRYNDIVNSYRDYNTGDLMYNRIPKDIRKELRTIQVQMNKIKNKAKRGDKHLASLMKKRAELYKKYTDTVPTKLYHDMLKSYNKIYEDDPMQAYEQFLLATHVTDPMDPELTGRIKREYSKLVAKPEYMDDYMELVPGDGYVEAEQSNEYFNDKFDESYGKKWVPKRTLYDNSKQYQRIMKSDTLKALYEESVKTMEESNKSYNTPARDSYLLPQITGSLYKRLSNQTGKWRKFLDWVGENLGIGSQSVLQDPQYGAQSSDGISTTDDSGRSTNEIYSQDVLLSSTRPDGRSLGMIPQYYTKRLDDSGQLSADLIGILCEYYNKSKQFENKKKIQGTCEALVDMMQNRKVRTKSAFAKNPTEKMGIESNNYLFAKKFLEMNLYNKRTNSYSSKFNIAGREITINWGVMGSLLRSLVGAINLGCSVAVAGTGFMSTMFSHMIQACTGQHYGIREASASGMQAVYDVMTTSPFAVTGTVLGTMLCNPLLGVPAGVFLGSIFDRVILRRGIIQNRLSNNLTVARMEFFNIGNQGERKYKHSNRNEIVNTANDNWCYGLLTFTDFITKSQIMNSTLMSFRYYKGEFCTKEDLKINFANKPYDEYKQALKEWNEGVSVYSLHTMKDGEMHIRDKYKQYEQAYKTILPILKSRIETYAESADGMQTQTQKSAMTANFLGACVLQHRQYLPVMLQERWGDASWNMETQQMNGGIFKSILDWHLLRTVGSAIWGASIDAFTAKRSFGEAFRDRAFVDTESLKDKLSRQYKIYKLKQVAFEVGFINLLISPLVTMLMRIAANDDDDDKLLQLLTYISMRGLWESQGPYLMSDLANNFKTVMAATSITDKIQNLSESFLRTYFPRATTGGLFDTLLQSTNKTEYVPVVKRGAYKGWSKLNRDLFKFTPMHNAYEQYYGTKDKIKYFKNQVMKVND